ncbi:ATP-binding protein [Streptomyces sp. H51]|uniref:ATP-binding protein n=1 Tax=Streptomyces sp. H51 TaxID=3111770 RepID=UPI002D76E5C9|nr:ATP-binding protein [Streptomyces sp. H51]
MPHTQVRFTVEATPAAVHGARHRISATVRSWGASSDEELFSRLELVASELLTNGLQHAGGPMTVEVSLEQGFLVIAVLDGSRNLPQPSAAAVDDERGRGLLLIETLCLFQGVERTDSGKRCWAVLPVSTGPAPAAGRSTQDGSAPDARWSVTAAGERLLSNLFEICP